ncbi:mannosyltransferase [Rhizobium sp. Root274]|uniref:glycosyltransferase family 4 protein n=1 Tax=unclassified Rhizobium TaxID=2613769 RepID=UPI000715204C|nr:MULTISPECIES: glycosyltransferase family 1 protein [unclassified Rhizobium]KQW31334.1 mannosyltransferase [Rhizobium sp. Root1240]KRD32878.1 mannosyltransferase [Rhizobium sp. Root274]
MKTILSIDPIRFPLTGIGRYTFELGRHLQQSTEISDLRFLSGFRFTADLPVPSNTSDGNHRLKRWVQKSDIARRLASFGLNTLKSRALRGHEDFLYHGPNYYLPQFGGRRVVTFHDLSPFRFPDCNEPQTIRILQNAMKQSARVADVIITDAEFNRQETASFFSWPLEKVHAVPLACSPEFAPRSESEIRETLAKYDLHAGGYSLFVGTIEPRKNLLVLLAAYSRLPDAVRRRWPLVLSGYKGWRNETIQQQIRDAELQGWARYLGFLPAQDLPLLYSGARLFTFPSKYEGFGLPILEAMASGVPVVCSNSSSLPEVAGDAALTCDPAAVEILTDHIYRGLEDEQWREQAIAKGFVQVSTFSWQRCAEKTLKAYEAALAV